VARSSRRAVVWVRPLPYALTLRRQVSLENPWLGGSPVGVQTPQLLHALQQLLHIQYAQQQQLQQVAQFVPQQLQLIQQLIQIVAPQQQPYPMWSPQQQSFAPTFSTPSLAGPSGWLGTQAAQQPIFGGQPGLCDVGPPRTDSRSSAAGPFVPLR
jgi:hypothetical protein